MDLEQLIQQISSANGWDEITLAVSKALTSMGTFAHPLDPSLANITYQQWQLESCRRAVLAVLHQLHEQTESKNRNKCIMLGCEGYAVDPDNFGRYCIEHKP